MRKMIDEWGWDWYGRYWAILGKIGMLVTEKNQTFALQTNDERPFPVKLLADDLGTTVERLTNFCDFLADNRLIDQLSWKRKSLIYAPKLRERADEYTRKLLTNSRHSPDQEVEVDKKKNIKIGVPPLKEDVDNYFKELLIPNESAKFYDHFSSNGWKVSGRATMKDWKAAARQWKRRGLEMGTIKQSKILNDKARFCESCGAKFQSESAYYGHQCPKAVPPPKEFVDAINTLSQKMLGSPAVNRNESFRCPRCKEIHSPNSNCQQ